MHEKLNGQFGLPGLRFEPGNGGLIRAIADSTLATGELYLQGAHVTSWCPVGQKPVLWASRASNFERGKPIRGGIPICFPWFGPNEMKPTAPAHGHARLVEWQIAETRMTNEGGIAIRLETRIDSFDLSIQVEFGSVLRMTLRTQLPLNVASSESFEDALHTYFSVSDVRSISIAGLESTGFIDKVENAARKPAAGVPITIVGETDRVYVDTLCDCVLKDDGMNRAIRVSKSGSNSTVIWNPWIDKSKRMVDFGDEEWREMVCIETANVLSNRIELSPGQSHSTTTVIALETR